MEILFYFGAGCKCCSEFRPKVTEFAKKHGLKVTDVDIRDYESPNRYLVDIEGVPATALKDRGKILAVVEGNRYDSDCFKIFEEKMKKNT